MGGDVDELRRGLRKCVILLDERLAIPPVIQGGHRMIVGYTTFPYSGLRATLLSVAPDRRSLLSDLAQRAGIDHLLQEIVPLRGQGIGFAKVVPLHMVGG